MSVNDPINHFTIRTNEADTSCSTNVSGFSEATWDCRLEGQGKRIIDFETWGFFVRGGNEHEQILCSLVRSYQYRLIEEIQMIYVVDDQ